MLPVFPLTIVMVVIIHGCISSVEAVGQAGYEEICFPDFEEDYHITKYPEFRAHKFLCTTEKNLECNIPVNITRPERSKNASRVNENQNVSSNNASIADGSDEKEETWLCGCEAGSTYIEFGKSRYWKEIIIEAQRLQLDIHVYDLLNQSYLFKSKCVSRLNSPCQSDDRCAPNAACVSVQEGVSVCRCQSDHISILEACYYHIPILDACCNDTAIEAPYYSSGRQTFGQAKFFMIFLCYVTQFFLKSLVR